MRAVRSSRVASYRPNASAGSAVPSKASVADQLQEVDTSVLDRLVGIRQEESRLQSFRARAGEMKGQVSEPVYRRVLEDYTKRANALEQQATPLKTKGRAEYRKLHTLIGDVTRVRDQARLLEASFALLGAGPAEARPKEEGAQQLRAGQAGILPQPQGAAVALDRGVHGPRKRYGSRGALGAPRVLLVRLGQQGVEVGRVGGPGGRGRKEERRGEKD